MWQRTAGLIRPYRGRGSQSGCGNSTLSWTDFEEKVKSSRETYYSSGNEWFIFLCKSWFRLDSLLTRVFLCKGAVLIIRSSAKVFWLGSKKYAYWNVTDRSRVEPGNNRTQCHFILLPIFLSVHHERQDKGFFFRQSWMCFRYNITNSLAQSRNSLRVGMISSSWMLD